MDRLYTPWRRSYVVNQKPTDCPFCDYITGDPGHDAENRILYRGEYAYIILNRFPYNSGHLMVLPNVHVSTLMELDADCQTEMMQMTTYCTFILEEAYHPQGFNIGVNIGAAAGAGMAAHLHFHIVPRWNGDTNFMPVVAETRVLPEWLDETYERLRAIVDKHPFVNDEVMK
ncbi:MAG: HIT domain-containing protein [Caldilineales bacterium]|nr:HIT domain-containing protein [Caldilineales bacterium]